MEATQPKSQPQKKETNPTPHSYISPIQKSVLKNPILIRSANKVLTPI